MTERPRPTNGIRSRRWIAVALLAPASALAFLGSVAWSQQHAVTPAAASAPANSTGPDPTVTALRSQVTTSRAELRALRKQVDALRARAARVGAASSGGSSGGGAAGGSAGGSTSSGSSGAATTHVAPAPAPPVHTTTGAS